MKKTSENKTILRLKMITRLITVISGLAIVFSYVGLFVMSERKTKLITNLNDSLKFYKNNPSYIVFASSLLNDTLIGTHFIDKIYTDGGDTIKNIKYQKVKVTRSGVLYTSNNYESVGILKIRYDTVRLNVENSKIILNIIKSESNSIK